MIFYSRVGNINVSHTVILYVYTAAATTPVVDGVGADAAVVDNVEAM